MLAVGLVLYFVCDKALDRLEHIRGKRFEDRSIVFLGLLTASLLAAFFILDTLFGG